jgi:GGDEF domain-containing protein
VIELVDFQYNDEPLLALIAERLHSQTVGLIYFDIAEFSQIERIYGTQVCEQILKVLKDRVTRVTPDSLPTESLEMTFSSIQIYLLRRNQLF